MFDAGDLTPTVVEGVDVCALVTGLRGAACGGEENPCASRDGGVADVKAPFEENNVVGCVCIGAVVAEGAWASEDAMCSAGIVLSGRRPDDVELR